MHRSTPTSSNLQSLHCWPNWAIHKEGEIINHRWLLPACASCSYRAKPFLFILGPAAALRHNNSKPLRFEQKPHQLSSQQLAVRCTCTISYAALHPATSTCGWMSKQVHDRSIAIISHYWDVGKQFQRDVWSSSLCSIGGAPRDNIATTINLLFQVFGVHMWGEFGEFNVKCTVEGKKISQTKHRNNIVATVNNHRNNPFPAKKS